MAIPLETLYISGLAIETVGAILLIRGALGHIFDLLADGELDRKDHDASSAIDTLSGGVGLLLGFLLQVTYFMVLIAAAPKPVRGGDSAVIAFIIAAVMGISLLVLRHLLRLRYRRLLDTPEKPPLRP